MNHADLGALSDSCEVPFTTLMKIRQGTTSNPGIDTVRKFMPFLEKAVCAKQTDGSLPRPSQARLKPITAAA